LTQEDPEEYGYAQENLDFINALEKDEEPPITHRDGMRATLLILRAFESIKTHTPQSVSF